VTTGVRPPRPFIPGGRLYVFGRRNRQVANRPRAQPHGTEEWPRQKSALCSTFQFLYHLYREGIRLQDLGLCLYRDVGVNRVCCVLEPSCVHVQTWRTVSLDMNLRQRPGRAGSPWRIKQQPIQSDKETTKGQCHGAGTRCPKESWTSFLYAGDRSPAHGDSRLGIRQKSFFTGWFTGTAAPAQERLAVSSVWRPHFIG